MQKLKILHTSYLTHDVKRFVLEKPEGLIYRPGQAAHLSVNLPEWKEVIRPFTFTSLNAWPELEFTIKCYEKRNGVTAQLEKLKPGDELLLHDIFDTIDYKGPGIFIAGGTGITPFIAIFRALYATKNLRGIALLYSNKTEHDIILGNELHHMLGNAYVNVFTRQGVIGFRERRIDRSFLIENIGNFNLKFYVCGPKEFTHDLSETLIDLGANPTSIIV